MSFLEFTVRLIEATIWPGALFAVICLLREPLKSLVLLVEKLQYKELTISFRKAAEDALDSVGAREKDSMESAAHAQEIVDPRLAVLSAWQELEDAAMAKLRELAPEKNNSNLGPDRALGYFEYMGVLIPRTRQALYKLRRLRDQAVHSRASAMPFEGARAYVKAAVAIRRQIEALSVLPQLKLNRMTILISEYNHLLDTGKYNHITIEDIHREIEQGTVLRYLQRVAGADVDLSLFLDSHDELGFEEQYARYLQAIYGGYAGRERRKWGIGNLGLCLLIAWTNEIIQQGSGWHPNEDVP